MTDEELSHCILSTYEYYEYKVLCERLFDKVKYIIPPVEHEDTYDKGFVRNADALSKEYIENELIQKYIKDQKYTIILFENPPYAESNGTTKISSFKNSYVVQEMKKEVSGVASNDLSNAFIWSAFKYYLRQNSDSYVVFSPIKYWKVQHLIDKEFLDGFAFNRKHFHTKTNACISAILWSNKDNNSTDSIILKAFDIKENTLISEDILPIYKVKSLYSQKYFDKSKCESDEPGITLALTGIERDSPPLLKAIFNENIVGYLVANGAGFDNPDLNCGLTVAGRYDGHGFYLRKDTYLEKLPLFAAGRYITYNKNWTERARIMKSGDGANRYFKDIEKNKLNQPLLKTLLFCVLEMQNHMRSFTGSDGRFYRNELCLDTSNGSTLASENLKELIVGPKEMELLDLWDKILKDAKKTANYNKSLTYGIYQIQDELNTSFKNDLNKVVYDYPILNGDLSTLKTLIRKYYIEEIVPFLFEYEFLK